MTIDMNAEYAGPAMFQEYLKIVDVWTADAAAYRAAAASRSELGVVYGARPRQRLDLFFPQDDAKRASSPIVLFLHGGYWQTMDRSSFSHMARGANEHGVTVAVAEYTLCPEVKLSELVDETREAVAFLAKRFGRPVTVCGHSAGGHLTACMLATEAPVTAGLAVSGLFALEPLVATMLNDKLGLDLAEARRLSPIAWKPPAGKRLIAYVGGNETSEFRRQTTVMADTWRAAGVVASAVEVPNETHFSVVGALADAESAMVKDLASLAFSGRPGF